LGRMNANLSVILGVEALCGAQGIDFRAPLVTSPRLRAVMDVLRQKAPGLESDRYLAPEIEGASALIRDGSLVRAAGLELVP
ncbi:MAG TPA: histidine ammonia-lyase, partial [Paracoccus sp.]|nr:histidine ammonia-lyase [Paracoccus sp. (in: a-proteobacteria)]